MSLVVVPLILNVFNDRGYIRLANAKNAVTILPSKLPERLIHPLRRVALQPLCDLSRRMDGLGHGANMKMVFDSAHLNGGEVVLSRDSADVRPNAIFDVGVDQVNAAFSTEHEVVE